jgi:hypothetical protein
VRLADLVGTERGGAGSVELTAATAFTVRLAAAVHGIMMGGAAAPGRPPPAVRPRHRATGEVRKGRWILKVRYSVSSKYRLKAGPPLAAES